LQDNASFAALMKYSTAIYKDVFQTVEIMLTSFQVQEFVNARKDFIEFKDNVEFVQLDKFMMLQFNVVQENKLFAMQIKFMMLLLKHAFVLLVLTESMVLVFNVQLVLIMMPL
jgi:hypothetical protein